MLTWNVEREIVALGPVALRWYSLLFAAGIVAGYLMVRRMMRDEGKPESLMDGLLLHVVAGTVVGARLGHCLFYEPGTYLADPLRILKIWEGGLASHGGYLGVIIALALFARRHKEVSFFWLADRCAIPAMLAAAMIRVGNFFNSEILGRPAEVPWAVVFQKVDGIARHPTQLYEAAGYLAVFGILYGVYRAAGKAPPEGRLLGLVMILAYSFRLFIERFKENQVGFEDELFLNMGQLLSVPFIAIGIALVVRSARLARQGAPVVFADGGDAVDFTPAPLAASRRGQLRKQMRKAKR